MRRAASEGAWIAPLAGLAALAALAACHQPTEPSLPPTREPSIGAELPLPRSLECLAAASPIEVVVAHLVAREDLWDPPERGPLAVGASTNGESAFLSPKRVATDLDGEHREDAAALNAILRESNRTRQAVRLNLPIDGVVVRELGEAVAGPATWSGEFRGRVQFWAPAVSADGERALVRFWLGPTAHGAIGTFCLVRCADGGWRILWSEFSYYA